MMNKKSKQKMTHRERKSLAESFLGKHAVEGSLGVLQLNNQKRDISSPY